MDQTKYKWGYSSTWADTDQYSSRMYVILEGQQTPYIYHKTQDITIFVLQGEIHLFVEGKTKLIKAGETQRIIPKVMHRLIALKGDAVILESGTKIEDDIVVVQE